MESGCDLFLSVEGPTLEALRRGGVVGGVSNMSSEEELRSRLAGSPASSTCVAWVGIANEVSKLSELTMSSAISWSG